MKNQKGFTLIELLLVLAIIGIISAIAIPALLGQREKAKAKATQSMVANIASELTRVNDDLRQAGGTAPTATVVVNAALKLSNYKYPAAKNPYGGSVSPYSAAGSGGAGSSLGMVYLTANSAYADPANSTKTYPAVTISGSYLESGVTKTIKKVIALD